MHSSDFGVSAQSNEARRLFPISHIVYEYIKARGDKGFSPAMVGQKVMLEWLEKIAPTTTQFGWLSIQSQTMAKAGQRQS